MRIDADTHIFPKEVLAKHKDVFTLRHDDSGKEWVEKASGGFVPFSPLKYDIKIRLDSMRDAGFEKEVLLGEPLVPLPFEQLETSIRVTRTYNDEVAKLGDKYDEFIPIAEVPHQDGREALAELERAVEELGMKGVRLFGSWCGKNLNAADYWPFFEKVEKLGIPIFIHHLGLTSLKAKAGQTNPFTIGRDRIDPLVAILSLGFMFEGMMGVSSLILGGVLERYRGIKVVINEAGSAWIPSLMARLDQDFELRNKTVSNLAKAIPIESGYKAYPIKRLPSEQIREHFIFCIDSLGDAKALSFLVDTMKLEANLAAQTDFPHVEGSNDCLRWILGSDISETAKEKIMGGNVGKILHIN